MWSFIQAHQVIAGMVLMWIVCTAIGAMPTPRDNSTQFYEWAFKFLQGIGSGLARVMAIYRPDILTTLTGQQVKPTVPPNPPIAAGEGK